MELLERDAHMATPDDCLEQARSGRGTMVLLAGEAGIGKTSLTWAFCVRHAADGTVLRGACDALRTPRPLGPLHDIARAAEGELAGMMVSDGARYERFSALLDVLTDSARPTVAVIEDVQWADEATLALLLFEGRRIETTNSTVLVTYRDDEVAPDHPLRELLGRLTSAPAVRRLHLSPLSQSAVAELAAGRVADVDRPYRITGLPIDRVSEIRVLDPYFYH